MKLIQPQNGVIPKSAELQEHYTSTPRQLGPVVRKTKMDIPRVRIPTDSSEK